MQKQGNVRAIDDYYALADTGFSCKHLCCREGVDPKSKRFKAIALPACCKGDHSAVADGSTKPLLVVQKEQFQPFTRANVDGGIEVLDLSTSIKAPDDSIDAAREWCKPDCLHEAITNGDLVPAATQSPSFNHGESERTCISSLTTDKRHTWSKSPSTLCSDDWANELPSLVDIIDNERFGSQHELKRKPEPHNGSRASLHHPGAFQQENKAPDNYCGASDHVIDNDLFHQNRDNLSAGGTLSGLSASTKSQQSIQNQEGCSLGAKEDVPAIEAQSDKLFRSAGTEMPPTLAEKRAAEDLAQECSSLSASASKRRKVSERSEQTCQIREKLDESGDKSLPTVKSGLPAWVYDFDPAFIAEYQDFVEFV